jgi:hypothetical protein
VRKSLTAQRCILRKKRRGKCKGVFIGLEGAGDHHPIDRKKSSNRQPKQCLYKTIRRNLLRKATARPHPSVSFRHVNLGLRAWINKEKGNHQ